MARVSTRGSLHFYLTGFAAACCVISIAAFEILMGMALVAMIVTWHERRSAAHMAGLYPLRHRDARLECSFGSSARRCPGQIKKFYVYLMLFLVTSVFRNVRQVRWLAIGWALAASLSSAWALKQFAGKYVAAERARRDFYNYYVADRVTGFMGHWMTFSGEMMIALLTIGAVVFFSKDRRFVFSADSRRSSHYRGPVAGLHTKHAGRHSDRRNVLDLVLAEMARTVGAGARRGPRADESISFGRPDRIRVRSAR